MTHSIPAQAKEIELVVTEDATVDLRLIEKALPEPGEGEILVRVEACPINPSDIGSMFGMTDLATVRNPGPDRAVIDLRPGAKDLPSFSRLVGVTRPAGGEGAGVIVASAANPELVGRTVAFMIGRSYAQYRAITADECIVFPEGVDPKEAASSFVNPLTVLGMVETMRREGHKAIVHTAAASNLGQMLLKLCQAEGIELVTVVRKAEQVALLEGLGAKHIVNSSSPNFFGELVDALAETDATIGFEAIGGGELAGTIVDAMEAALMKSGGAARGGYGTDTMKQVYIYGGLDPRPSIIPRRAGMAWGVGGWLLPYFLNRIGPEAAGKLKARVAREIGSTFASSYTKEVSLHDMLEAETIKEFARMGTGEKYLVRPQQ